MAVEKLVDKIPDDIKNKKLTVDEADTTAPGKPIIEEVGSELAKKKKHEVEDTPAVPKGGMPLCELTHSNIKI